MPRKKKHDERPAQSNRGRLDARGVFIVFDEQKRADEPGEDELLARDVRDEDRR